MYKLKKIINKKKMKQIPFSMDGLFDLSDLSPQTQRHLRRVYSYLSSGIAVAILCFILAQFCPSLSGIFIFLGVLSLVADIVLICLSRNTTWGRRFSFASLYGYASSVGGSLGGVISQMDSETRVDNLRYCMSAFVSALIIFVMVSIFSTLTSNRVGVYALSTIASLVLGIISFFFFGGSAIISVILGMLYVITDTQNIIYRAKNNVSDAVMDAKLLFIDLVKIFYKLYEYIQKNNKDKKKKKEK